MTADQALARLWEMATADPRELIEIVVGACRHCWGLHHYHQYTAAEYARAQSAHSLAEVKRRRGEGEAYLPQPMPEQGGAGYDANRHPHPECPECWGRGQPRVVLKDMACVSPGASMLLAGVKLTERGPQLQLRSPLPALIKVGQHLGLWNKNDDPNAVGGDDPLRKLLDEIRGSTMPIVRADPET